MTYCKLLLSLQCAVQLQVWHDVVRELAQPFAVAPFWLYHRREGLQVATHCYTEFAVYLMSS